jgi:hypothetical protein
MSLISLGRPDFLFQGDNGMSELLFNGHRAIVDCRINQSLVDVILGNHYIRVLDDEAISLTHVKLDIGLLLLVS